MCCPGTAEEAAALLRLLHESGAPFELMGNGTNLLVPDEGLDKVVVRLGEAMSEAISLGDGHIRAGAGITLAKLAVFAANEGLSGLEFAHGIPGSLGGAVFMNAGAYGGEMKDVLESVEYADTDGVVRSVPASELGLSYRHSAFEGTKRLVTAATVRLAPKEPGGDKGADAAADGKAPGLAAAGCALGGQHIQAACRRLCGGAHRRGGAEGLRHRRGAGVGKARGLCREPGRREL